MKWRKETKVYMWANYYSEDGQWKAYDQSYPHIWILENLKTGEIRKGFKTLKSAKAYAENFK